jgi:Secretion system C-terminal sorting domain
MKFTKNFLFSTLLFFIGITTSISQQSIIFIEDSSDTFGNSRYLATALDSLALDYFYYDTETSGLPTLEMLTTFDLVIWHTSTWGVGLYFWESVNTENHLIKQYLDNPKANLWLIGNDFLFQEYEGAPDVFSEGSFPYDYLGITAYKAQSYGDDGGLGVPFLVPSATNVIEDLTQINWIFPTLNWADSYEIRETATPIFEFGGDNYSLKGATTAFFFPRENGSNVMTFGFDLSLCSNIDTMVNTVQQVTDLFNKVSSTQNIVSQKQNFKVYPSIFTDNINVSFEDNTQKTLSIVIYNTQGQIVGHTKSLQGHSDVMHISIPETLPKGVYYCEIKTENTKETHKLIKI